LRQVRELVITQPQSPDDEAEASDVPADKRKGKGKEHGRTAGASAASDIPELQDGDLPRTTAGEEHRNKRGALHNRLRDCYVVLHRIKFLQGDVHHMLGPSHAAEEDAAYQEAESIRRSLLKCRDALQRTPYSWLTHFHTATELSAMRAMKQLTHSVASQDLSEDALLIDSPFMVGAGLKSQILVSISFLCLNEVDESPCSLTKRTKLSTS
jgi:E3 ubiquitin-protein ligase SHPRH